MGSRIPRNVGTEITGNVGAGIPRNGEGRSWFSREGMELELEPEFPGMWDWNSWGWGDPEFPGNVGSRIPGNLWDPGFQGKGWSWDWRIPRNVRLEFLGIWDLEFLGNIWDPGFQGRG